MQVEVLGDLVEEQEGVTGQVKELEILTKELNREKDK